MSFAPFDDSDLPAWGAPPPSEDPIRDALRKQELLKDIIASQEDLRVMLAKIKAVQTEVDSLTTGNETLQTYIDNLTVQMAKRR